MIAARFRHIIPVLALAAAACAPKRATADDYFAVLPDMARFAIADAQRNALGPKPAGPVWADVPSFQGGGYQVTLTLVPRERVLKALGPGVQPIHRDSALVCDQEELTAGCYVRQYGTYLHLNTTRASPNLIEAYVSARTTDRRTFPTRICERVWQMNYARQTGGWKNTGRDLIRRCDGQ